MIKLSIPIIVEGKYDKILISSIFDCTVIETRGFGVFNDDAKIELIKKAAGNGFVAILTDSDGAGQQIRAFLKNKAGLDKTVNVYVPKIEGKERRKKAPSRSGIIGVEGMRKSVIIDSFLKSGILTEVNGEYYENSDYSSVIKSHFTKVDLYSLGLYGQQNSAELRSKLLQKLSLDEQLPVNTFIEIINREFTPNELENAIKEVDV
ncbi:MAG: DUF4093 domain-containing protein [Oscillospiraceae bacterium]|nr:DUF4093 domain-containing protein [Candidatus Equicaccousia limihippi]